ncbi:MAG: hypothetical protein P8X90_06445 [Desulfobacterales bacterium]|jgi:hypothetical protein
MPRVEAILLALIIMGCVMKEEPVKTFTARQVTEDNIFAYASVAVKVNPRLDYLKISGTVEKEVKGVSNDPTTREFYLFARFGSDEVVLIETHTRDVQNPFQLPQDELLKNVPVIQKGRKPIDGKSWEIYIRALSAYPEQILNAVRQKGIMIEQYRCGLEIGAGRVLDRFHRIYIKYIQGQTDCQTLPQNGSVLSDDQVRFIRELAGQFDKNITISDQSAEP